MIVCDSYVRHPVCFCLRDLVPLKSFRFYDLLLSLVCSLVQYWASLISRKNLPQPKAFLSHGQVSGSSSVNIISPKKSPPQRQFIQNCNLQKQHQINRLTLSNEHRCNIGESMWIMGLDQPPKDMEKNRSCLEHCPHQVFLLGRLHNVTVIQPKHWESN